MNPSMLVLGGTSFIGRVFCEQAINNGKHTLTLLNRGVTNPDLFQTVERLRCDRNDADQCAAQLAGRRFDYVVDFSGWQHEQIENVISNCRIGHYTYVSSSAVELSWPQDELFPMAQHKLWCEHLVTGACSRALVVRPGFVVGKYDSTNRFEMLGPTWVWRGSTDVVRPLVNVEFLASVMLQLIQRDHTGVFRAGYVKPRVTQFASA
jgi:2'-hydroxyisoflavone reductase